MSNLQFSQELAQEYYGSSEKFIIKFDDACRWLDFPGKKSFLNIDFVEGVDYIVDHNNSSIILTCDCFRKWSIAVKSNSCDIAIWFMNCEFNARSQDRYYQAIQNSNAAVRSLLDIKNSHPDIFQMAVASLTN